MKKLNHGWSVSSHITLSNIHCVYPYPSVCRTRVYQMNDYKISYLLVAASALVAVAVINCVKCKSHNSSGDSSHRNSKPNWINLQAQNVFARPYFCLCNTIIFNFNEQVGAGPQSRTNILYIYQRCHRPLWIWLRLCLNFLRIMLMCSNFYFVYVRTTYMYAPNTHDQFIIFNCLIIYGGNKSYMLFAYTIFVHSSTFMHVMA